MTMGRKVSLGLLPVRLLAVGVVGTSALLPFVAISGPLGCNVVQGSCTDVHFACAQSGLGRWCGTGTHGEICICNYPPN